MEKKNICENNVKDESYCELENCNHEISEASDNSSYDRELPFGLEPDKIDKNCWDINDEHNFEENRYYYDDNEYTLEDTWNAMTDGMYGDMPEGWDGDLEFLGY